MVETTSCTHGLQSIYYFFPGDISEISKYFKGVKFVDTMNEITNPPKTGVYALKQDGSIRVQIVGECPNFKNGSCKLGGRCIKKQVT